MKYIYSIIGLMLFISLAVVLQLFPDSSAKEDIVLTINDKHITQKEFDELARTAGPYSEDKDEFIKGLIIKELLIQEAEEQGLHKEESFRKSIKYFYEQSLTKLLVDQKITSFNEEVSEEEINKYEDMYTKILSLTSFAYSDENAAVSDVIGEAKGEKSKTPFPALSQYMQMVILSAGPDGITHPVKTEEGYALFRIEEIHDDQNPPVDMPDKDTVKNLFREYKIEQQINEWLADLNRKASIQVLIEQ